MAGTALLQANTRAVRLWQSLGFRIMATIPEAFDHPAQGLTGLHIMYRPLTGSRRTRGESPAGNETIGM